MRVVRGLKWRERERERKDEQKRHRGGREMEKKIGKTKVKRMRERVKR